MKLSELIQHLLVIAKEVNPSVDLDDLIGDSGWRVDPEVRMATQPNYPLAYRIQCVTLLREDEDEADELEAELPNETDSGKRQMMQQRIDGIRTQSGIVWIAEGGSVYDAPYAPGAAWG